MFLFFHQMMRAAVVVGAITIGGGFLLKKSYLANTKKSKELKENLESKVIPQDEKELAEKLAKEMGSFYQSLNEWDDQHFLYKAMNPPPNPSFLITNTLWEEDNSSSL